MNSIQVTRKPPNYFHYADGPCDQDFSDMTFYEGVFLYLAKPETMAHTIEAAVDAGIFQGSCRI